MTKISEGERGRPGVYRGPVLGAAAVLAAALSGCSVIGGSSTTSAPAAATTTTSASATTPAAGPPAGQLTGLRDGAKVARQQPVSGVATSLPAGDKAWLVIYPVKAPAYWPQQGPLQLDSAGVFRSTAVFGSAATLNIGEHFVLQLVITSGAATARFRAFLADPAHGLSKMPAGARTLTKVTVIRG